MKNYLQLQNLITNALDDLSDDDDDESEEGSLNNSGFVSQYSAADQTNHNAPK